MKNRTPFGGGSNKVWVGMILNERTQLEVIPKGAITVCRYIDEDLEQHVEPFAENMGPQFGETILKV